MFRLNQLLKLLDRFLAPDHKESAEERMRGRMIAFLFLTTATLNLAGALFNRLLSFEETITYLVFSGVSAGCLIMMRFFFSPEKVLTGFLSICLFIPVISLSRPEVPVFHLLYVYIILLALNFLLVSSLKTRLFFLVLAVMAQTLSFLILAERMQHGDLVLSYHSVEGAVSTVIPNVLSLFLFIAIILRIKTSAQSELHHEVDWQQRSSRLGELASMTTTMRLLLEKPLLSFKSKIELMAKDQDPELLKEMQAELEELLLVSQSFGWIYRAYRDEGHSSIGSATLMRQLQLLLETRCREEGWTLTMRQVGSPAEIYGPIPSIMLLLFTIVSQIVKEAQPLDKRSLAMEIDPGEDLVTCKVCWPADTHGFDEQVSDPKSGYSNRTPRQELIHELKQVCSAELRHLNVQGIQQLVVLGRWRRLDTLSV